MIVDICAKQLVYKRYLGLLAERLCSLKKEYVECFERSFQDQYKNVYRIENMKIRSVAKFFAHLLATDAISWSVSSLTSKLNK